MKSNHKIGITPLNILCNFETKSIQFKTDDEKWRLIEASFYYI